MTSNIDVIARSHDDQSGRRGNLSDGRDCFASLAMTTRVAAQELLPVLLLLYPLLLLLDDLEPGFVRSVVNPHWFLLVLLAVGIVAGQAGPSPTRSPSQREGEKLRAMLTLAAAIVVGFWVWWRVGGGRLGVVVGFLTAVAIAGTVIEMVREAVGRGMSKSKAQNSNEA